MKVSKIMTKTVGFCQTQDDLAKAVKIMLDKDCGIVPVVNERSEVIGMVSDRDIAVSLFLQNKTASESLIGEIISKKVIACSIKDNVDEVLRKMRRKQVKRLPVVNKKGKLAGIISITDILLAAGKDKDLKKKILKTLEAIGKPRPIVLKAIEN